MIQNRIVVFFIIYLTFHVSLEAQAKRETKNFFVILVIKEYRKAEIKMHGYHLEELGDQYFQAEANGNAIRSFFDQAAVAEDFSEEGFLKDRVG